MKEEKIGLRELRIKVAEKMNAVAFEGLRLILTRSGKEIGAIVPMSDLKKLKAIGNDDEKE